MHIKLKSRVTSQYLQRIAISTDFEEFYFKRRQPWLYEQSLQVALLANINDKLKQVFNTVTRVSINECNENRKQTKKSILLATFFLKLLKKVVVNTCLLLVVAALYPSS